MTRPFAVEAAGGVATWTDSLNLFKALAEDTGGALSLWESLIPRGSSPPLHVHRREDEAFYVLGGEMTFRVGDQLVRGRTGTFVWAPRDIAHQWRVDSHTARLLTLFIPGGGEGLFFHLSRPAEALTLPPPWDEPVEGPNEEQVAMLAERYLMEVVGPPMAATDGREAGTPDR